MLQCKRGYRWQVSNWATVNQKKNWLGELCTKEIKLVASYYPMILRIGDLIVCLFVCLVFIYLFIYWLIYLFVYLLIYLFVCLFISLLIYFSFETLVCLLVCSFVYYLIFIFCDLLKFTFFRLQRWKLRRNLYWNQWINKNQWTKNFKRTSTSASND